MNNCVVFFLCLFCCLYVCSAFKFAEESEDVNPYLEALKKHPWESSKGYVRVRKNAFLFWWLYFADGTHKRAATKPLIIWIQGGPGLAATGIANFAEIGPLDMFMQPRNHTWVKGRNVLLIDHPVGTGFSYAVDDNEEYYAKSDHRVAMDLFRAIKGFLKVHREYENVPTYIASQSYGGKIAPRLTYILHKAIKSGHVKMKLKGVGIGSSWVDPEGTSRVLPHYLYHMGLIDINAYRKTIIMANQMAKLISEEKFSDAINEDTYILEEYVNKNHVESFNNVAKPDVYKDMPKLADFINKYVKPTLAMVNQSRIWNYESNAVFQSLGRNIMLPSHKFVERLLNETDIRVVVYNGNLDAVCPMAGAVNWVHNLKWSGAQELRNKRREMIPGEMTGFYKAVGRLSLWWVLNAGHWIPEDNPVAMEQILQYLTNDANETQKKIV